MAHRFEKGKPIYFLFKNGYTVQDSQLKPRYYLDRKRAEEYLPYGDEIVEYAPTIEAEPVMHGEPLTIEELRKMHGEPVWIEQENAWGIVNVDTYGQWSGIPFITFFYENIRCNYNIEDRGLTCYRYKPERHGRWEWFEDWVPSTPDHPAECIDCGWQCGECKTALEDVVGGYWDTPYEKPELHYCPNCGAIMDLKGD